MRAWWMVGLMTVAACASNGRGDGDTVSPAAVPVQGADSVRGVVAVVGTDRDPTVVLKNADGDVEIAGPANSVIRRLAGLDLRLEGRWLPGRTPFGARRFEAAGFVVRESDGAPVLDGRLERDGASLVLVTADGQRHVIVSPPQGIASRVGSRVWIAGDVARGPVTYGYIDPP